MTAPTPAATAHHAAPTSSTRRLPWRHMLAGALLASTLAGCVPLVVGGAVGGVILATDRRTSGAQLDDEGIELRTRKRVSNALSSRAHVIATSYNRILLLTGQAPTEADRQIAETTARNVPNVRAVVNEVVVQPNATMAQRTSDSLTSSRVKAALASAAGVQSKSIKVVTELGTVYLMGIVSQREADTAANVVRDINGVLKVVKVFEIVPEEALQSSASTVNTQQPAPVAE